MQKRNEIVFGDIDGVYVIADDIIVAAKNKKKHDAIMLSLLKRAKQKSVCFNRDNIQCHPQLMYPLYRAYSE